MRRQQQRDATPQLAAIVVDYYYNVHTSSDSLDFLSSALWNISKSGSTTRKADATVVIAAAVMRLNAVYRPQQALICYSKRCSDSHSGVSTHHRASDSVAMAVEVTIKDLPLWAMYLVVYQAILLPCTKWKDVRNNIQTQCLASVKLRPRSAQTIACTHKQLIQHWYSVLYTAIVQAAASWH
eukprot:9368-Heterococcus_DN1.PRE.6